MQEAGDMTAAGLRWNDTGVHALAALLAIHNITVTADQLGHELGHSGPVTAQDLVRLARRHDGVRCKTKLCTYAALMRLPAPLLGYGPDGWFLIGRASPDAVVIQRATGEIERLERSAFELIWSGAVILLTTRGTVQIASPGRFGLSWFIPRIVRYRALIAEVLLITFALNLLGLAAPLLFQNVIDKVVVHNTRATLNVLIFAFVAASAWEGMFGWLRVRLYSETCQKIDVELGAVLFQHLMRLPLSYFENRRTGDTVTRVRQLEAIREFLMNASLSVLVDPPFALLFIVLMWIYAPVLCAIVLFSLPLYFCVSYFVTGALRRRLADKFEQGSASNAFLVEQVSAIHTIKAAAVEPMCQNRWEQQLAGYSAASQRVINLANSSTQLVQLISKLSMAACLYLGALKVVEGGLTIGELVAFNMLAQRVSQPVLRLAQLWQDFQSTRLSVERLGDVLLVPPEARTTPQSMQRLRGSITFEDVSFRYGQEGPPILQGLSFSLESGETLGVVGSSGSGKSTIVKLAQRLYLPSAGRVLVDGIDTRQLDPAWLRRQIGVVLQENLLFSRSVRDNIALANPGLAPDQVVHAAQLAGAHDFIVRMPHGYDTMIEERGVNLSGGQRQRLAIARALVMRPPILIFDEATSALDAESEEIIQANLQTIAQGRTLIIVAHRLSAIRRCDRIIVIEQGRMVESGSHRELVLSGGRYADLFRRQAGLAGQAA